MGDGEAEGGGSHSAVDLYLGEKRHVAGLSREDLEFEFGAAAQGGVGDGGHEWMGVKYGAVVFAEADEMGEGFHKGLELCAGFAVFAHAKFHWRRNAGVQLAC